MILRWLRKQRKRQERFEVLFREGMRRAPRPLPIGRLEQWAAIYAERKMGREEAEEARRSVGHDSGNTGG